MKFNIDKTVNVDAETEKKVKTKVSHLWDESGNCLQERLGLSRWSNVKAACQFMLKDDKLLSVTTICGVTVYRGWIK